MSNLEYSPYFPLIFFYGFYLFMIILIAIGSPAYRSKKLLLLIDLLIPFYRIFRELWTWISNLKTIN